jgi:transcriptional regulator
MYLPDVFREERLEVLHGLIRHYPLATLVTAGPQGLAANPIPFFLAEAGDKGTLRAHLAKGNPQVADLRAGCDALVIFSGPQAYVTPSWYPSKAEHGKVAPTWNYATVQVRGQPRIIDDSQWLLALLGDFTDSQEQAKPHPWRVADAPEDYLAAALRGLVGLEIPIESIVGKWKVSQNRSENDRRGVARGLAEDDRDAAMAALVAATL